MSVAEQFTKERAAPLAPAAKPQRNEAHDKLDIFEGIWTGEGIDGTEMTTREEYAWLLGKFFLEVRFDQRVPGHPHTGIGFIGVDGSLGYIVRMADNLGYERAYVLREAKKGVWTMNGERERATFTFDEKNDAMDVWWEYTKDGRDWETLCKFRQKKQPAVSR